MDGVADLYPIQNTYRNYHPKWIAKSMQDYKKLRESQTSIKKTTHLMQCPGIFQMFKEGYIVRAWFDFVITTNKNRDGFDWRIPSDTLLNFAEADVITSHPTQVNQFIPKREKQIDNIVKIMTPYHVIAPKGVKLLFMPLPYNDHFDFESSVGILDPQDSTEINIQLHWFKDNDEILVKAGTPLMYMLPLTEKKLEMVCRDATKKEKKFISKRKYIDSSHFGKPRSKIKNLYNKDLVQ